MRSQPSAPWRVIYIARGERQARQIGELLQQAGFLMDQRFLSAECERMEDIEIKVLESEAEEARLYLMEQGL